MIPGLRSARFPDDVRFRIIKVLYPLPQPDNYWGVLLPFKETSWGAQIPTVTGDSLSHALHGDPDLLLKSLGVPPPVRANRLPMEDKLCYEHQCKMCGMATKDCHPGSTKLPDCYVPPTENREVRDLATAVGRAWDEGRYVFVVEGAEFNLR